MAFFVDAAGIRSWWDSRKHADLALAFYAETNGNLVITDAPPVVEVDPEDVFNDRLRIPIQLAIRNLDNTGLRLTRVALRYPLDIDVTSAGRAKVDPTGRTVVYEHELGTLDPVGDYTPMAPLDEVVVPFDFSILPVATLAKGDVPIYFLTVIGAGQPPFEGGRFRFKFEVSTDNRRSVQGVADFKIEPGVDVLPPSTGRVTTRAANRREKSICMGLPITTPSQEWVKDVEGKSLQYRKWSRGSEHTWALSVQGVIRRVITDDNGDGNIDQDLIDEDGDGTCDVRLLYQEPQPAVDWHD